MDNINFLIFCSIGLCKLVFNANVMRVIYRLSACGNRNIYLYLYFTQILFHALYSAFNLNEFLLLFLTL